MWSCVFRLFGACEENENNYLAIVRYFCHICLKACVIKYQFFFSECPCFKLMHSQPGEKDKSLFLFELDMFFWSLSRLLPPLRRDIKRLFINYYLDIKIAILIFSLVWSTLHLCGAARISLPLNRASFREFWSRKI